MSNPEKIFPHEFSALKGYILQFIPEGTNRELAILKLDESQIYVTKAATEVDVSKSEWRTKD